jgi:glycosyltransferase involved in cell wall biosynthesis
MLPRMEILFVYGNMYAVGGIQTWLLRMCRALRAEGHEVALLTRPGGRVWDSTDELIEQVGEHAAIHYAGLHWFRAPRYRLDDLGGPDVIFPCNLEAFLLAAQVQERLARNARIVAGVFHPKEYCWHAPRLQRRWSQHLTRRLIERLPGENFLFATDGMARETGRCLGRDLSGSPVLPLPIETERLRLPPERRVDRRKIVSVARLAPYYTHHGHMIRVIRALRDQGHSFTYHAYGEGSEREALEREARRLDVQDAVFLHGSVQYDHFSEAVSDALVYVGLGTALIEAAASGVPALVAIDSHREAMTYGFIQDTTGNDIGGYVPGHPEFEIPERILWLADRSEEEYRAVAAASQERAQEFSLTRLLPRFLRALDGAQRLSLPVSRLDRALGGADWVAQAALLNLGAPDTMGHRHIRAT